MLTVALLLAVASVASANLGSCPTPELQKDFDLEKFAGVWYEIESGLSITKLATRCSKFKLEFREKGKAGMLHKYTTITGTSRSDYSDITTPKSSEPAKILVEPLKGSIFGRKMTFSIIDTDYESFAILYNCNKVLFAKHEDVYIMSRTKSLDDKKKMELYDILKKKNLPQRSLQKMDQDHADCEKDETKE